MHAELSSREGEGTRRLEGGRRFKGVEGVTLGDFWTWAFSDLVGERTLGSLAEFVVGLSLENLERPRSGRSPSLLYLGKRIEIRTVLWSGAMDRRTLQTTRFEVTPPSIDGDGEGGEVHERPVDCYVFCLLSMSVMGSGDPTDMRNWDFFVVEPEGLEEALGGRRSIRLQELCHIAMPLTHEQLRGAVRAALFVLSEPEAEDEPGLWGGALAKGQKA